MGELVRRLRSTRPGGRRGSRAHPAALLVGFPARPASAVAVVMMVVATYVHLVVHDPALFPLQPGPPVIPVITIALCGYVLWKGGGSGSLDLASERR